VGIEPGTLPGCEAAVGSEGPAQPKCEEKVGKPRYEAIEREQLCWRPIDIERLIGADHAARAVWEFVGGLDLSSYQEQARAVDGKAGRPGWDPRLLVSVWVYAYSKGVGSARAIEELCQWEPAYQWLTGSQVINAHTLSDFRVKHDKALNGLFAQTLGLLSAAGLITLERVMQDGTKIRAQAAADSFRRKERVEQALKEAKEQVAAVEAMSEEEGSRRRAKARERAARQRQERLEQALKEFEQLEKDGKDKEHERS
jgi:transposase